MTDLSITPLHPERCATCPPAANLSREDMLDIAAQALDYRTGMMWSLLGQSTVIESIFRELVEKIAPELDVANELVSTQRAHITALEASGQITRQMLQLATQMLEHATQRAREQHATIENLRVLHMAAAEESTRLKLLHIAVAGENAGLRNLLRVLTSGGSTPVIDIPAPAEQIESPPHEIIEPEQSDPVVVEVQVPPVSEEETTQDMDPLED